MEIFLFEHDTTYARLYNCSLYIVDAVPLSERSHPILGSLLITLFIVLEALYIPCIWAISRHMEHVSYKLMFCIGVLDMAALWSVGLASGVFTVEGAVFCSHPTANYWLGIAAQFFWLAESCTEFLLALNRCIDSWYPRLADALFEGWKVWLWMTVAIAYAFSVVYFCKTILFSSIYVSWYFNPHLGYIDDPLATATYSNKPHSIHNVAIASSLGTLYLAFSISLLLKRHYVKSNAQPGTQTSGGSRAQSLVGSKI